MVVKSDGTKWACQSCLKGHRVSGCTHTDRELTLVPKKGRPVTQCQHCRQERKKRSAHVSCDCGEAEKPHHPKEKCIHLREAEERARAGFREEPVTEQQSAHLAAVAEEQGCCCHHGGTCTCAMLKKETGGDSATPPHGPAVKPRLETTKSDGHITKFKNGHHAPVHRKNHLAHESGLPYKMPLPRAHTDQSVSAKARRSVDSLSLDNTMPFNPSAFTPQTSAPFNTERRMSKSEQPSPKLSGKDTACPTLGNPHLSGIDFSNIGPIQTNQSLQSTAADRFNYTTMEPMSGMTDTSFDPWSNLPSGDSCSMPNNNPFGVWPSQADVSGIAQPALTAASSGTQSEIDEAPAVDDNYGFGMPSIQEDVDTFGYGDAQTSGSPQSNRHSLPASFFTAMNTNSEWPFTLDTIANGQQKGPEPSSQPFNFDASWEMPNLPPVMDTFSKPQGGLPMVHRPASRSVGPRSAPNGDVLRQLFPEEDVNQSYFSSSSTADVFGAGPSQSTASLNATSAPMNFSQMDETAGFTSHSWPDGSMSMPNDPYSSQYDLDQDFSNPDFTNNWSQ